MNDTTTPKVGDVVETIVPIRQYPPMPAGARGIVTAVRPQEDLRYDYCWVDFVHNGGSVNLTCWSSELRVVGPGPVVRFDTSSLASPTVLVVVHDPTSDSITITSASKPEEETTPPAIVAGILRRAAMDVAKRHGINSADGLAEVLAGSAVTDA